MLNIVLYQPEIPENTGNIARTCVGFNCRLHLIRPYGFFLNDKRMKRSTVNYWQYLNLHEYDSWDDFVSQNKINQQTNIYFITRYGKKTTKEINFHDEEIYLVFGKESTGIDKAILKQNLDRTIRIPTTDKIRALNLSNCVAMLAYKYIETQDFNGLEIFEPFKKDFL
ncbi:MAG: tRNA (cytidine(34)-2'-O)-methyltransferase [Mycoplasma sp.]